MLLVAFVGRADAFAQSDAGNLWFVRGGLTPSFILPTNPFAVIAPESRDQIGWATGVTVEVGRRTDGSQAWHQLYNMPSYGFGISTAVFENHGRLIRPVEAYTFFSWPFGRLTDRLDFTSDFGMGLSWNWTDATPGSAPTRSVLGSDLNARIDWGVYLRYLATPHVAWSTGLDFTHRSNGGLLQPDQGINVLGPKLQVQYNFAPIRGAAPEALAPVRPFHPAWDVVLGMTTGVKNVIESTAPLVRRDFSTFEGTAAIRRHFYRFGRVTSGMDLRHDGAPIASAASVQPWSLGVYGGYEHIIGRFSAFMDVGYVVARGTDTDEISRLYERYGWRYQLGDRVFSTFGVRAINGRKADALEVGLGYRLGAAGDGTLR